VHRPLNHCQNNTPDSLGCCDKVRIGKMSVVGSRAMAPMTKQLADL